MATKQQTVLFRTSARTSVTYSGGDVIIAGLRAVSRKDIIAGGVKQIVYKAEVPQVYTVGANYALTASTRYAIAVYDPNRVHNGQNEGIKIYDYVTPPVLSTLGGTAPAQREAINVRIIAAINADASNHAIAVTAGSGNGFTITDVGGYFPVKSQTMTNVKGANTVTTMTNTDGTGFVSTDLTLTTAAVYQSGVGAILAQEAPVVDYVMGNIISGTGYAPPLTAPSGTTPGQPAVAGQNYDAFTILSLLKSDTPTITGHYTYKDYATDIWVDNGTGTSTTNLAGYIAFEREMHKLIAYTFQNDPTATSEFFDKLIVFQDPLGAAPTGTANTLGWQLSPYTSLYRINIGTQTIVTPVLSDTGLNFTQDQNAGDGSHTCASIRTIGAQQFVVGTDEFSVCARAICTDWTKTQFLVGLRKKEAYTADYNDYTFLAAIGGGSADGESVYTFGILNNAATVATDTGVNFVASASSRMVIKVAIDGTVTAFLNGVSYPIYSAGTTTLILTAGTVMIPFYQQVNIGSGNPVVTISEFVSFGSTSWIY